MEGVLQNFEEAALPHLGAAYNLARWLTRDDSDAEDVVQEAYLCALRHFGSFRGGESRPWLLDRPQRFLQLDAAEPGTRTADGFPHQQTDSYPLACA